ncbi:hypothetical protein TEA_010797 [Camellia sinensis var. sinensis]|uniref:Chromo domain-containing protein n=1 Tax=Camellia sinensis var. sinensis TaxID=542762 RepID=A0A4S4D1D4_CAMSN|nr:hypothetical protein TEA_010797 [Camellia sinensis var. sinensis]
MSSLVERLRVRSERRPIYNLDDSDDEAYLDKGKSGSSHHKIEKIIRPDSVSPLNDIDKILDSEMRPTVADDSDASMLGSKQIFVKQYLVKWKGLSYLHCTWVPEKEFLKAYKTHPRLRTKVNNFHRQMSSISNSEDDFMAIRPEWTTVDRILSCRARHTSTPRGLQMGLLWGRDYLMEQDLDELDTILEEYDGDYDFADVMGDEGAWNLDNFMD